jgi:F-type H+-transporting ATPase subunit epsilon
MAPQFDFQILTPCETVYEGKLTSLVAPQIEGSFGILAQHTSLVSRSEGGKVKVEETSKKKRYFEVGPGIVEVFKNRVVFLTKEAKEITASV